MKITTPLSLAGRHDGLFNIKDASGMPVANAFHPDAASELIEVFNQRTKARRLKINNEMGLFVCSMGKVFRVLYICETAAEANEIMKRDSAALVIAQDNNGLIYLANQYGSVAPAAVMQNMRDEQT